MVRTLKYFDRLSFVEINLYPTRALYMTGINEMTINIRKKRTIFLEKLKNRYIPGLYILKCFNETENGMVSF